uniref:Dynein light chain n=1 Tax=Cacopsylla melanoneura TaxID=428564 RepID=A0A8D8PQY0_9HEMI
MGPKPKAKGPPPPPPENYLKSENKVAVLKESTMSKAMQDSAINAALEGLDKYNTESEVAGHIKQFFDNTYKPFWQCTVGRNFGSFISYDDLYTYFYLGKVAILLYKNGSAD